MKPILVTISRSEADPMTALYQLASEYREAADRLNDLDLPDEVIADTLEGLAGAVESKSTNVAFVIRNLEGWVEQIKAAETEMAKRRKAIENRAARLRDYLLTNMERCGIRKIESPYFVLSIKNNPGSVEIIDESAIPPDYIREIPAKHEPDKALIKKAINDGFDVPGCRINQSSRVEIK